jgi:hypothetical protein
MRLGGDSRCPCRVGGGVADLCKRVGVSKECKSADAARLDNHLDLVGVDLGRQFV